MAVWGGWAGRWWGLGWRLWVVLPIPPTRRRSPSLRGRCPAGNPSPGCTQNVGPLGWIFFGDRQNPASDKLRTGFEQPVHENSRGQASAGPAPGPVGTDHQIRCLRAELQTRAACGTFLEGLLSDLRRSREEGRFHRACHSCLSHLVSLRNVKGQKTERRGEGKGRRGQCRLHWPT